MKFRTQALSLKIAFASRCKGEFWSIEELFQNILEALPNNIRVAAFSAPHTGAKLATIFNNLRWSRSIKGFDLVHVTGDIHYVVCGIRRGPVVLTIHDLRFIESARGLRRLLFWLFWLYLPAMRASKLTVISEFTKSRLLALCRINPDKLQVIPNCVSPEFHTIEKTWNSTRPCILQIGTTDNKNLKRVSEACAGLSVSLWILGRLNLKQKQMINGLGIDYLEFNNLSRDEVVSLYQKCDLVSFVSTYEGFGLPILEGQAVGRPVLTSDISPMREVAGTGALLVNPFEVGAIREGLLRLIGDPGLRERLVGDGFANVKNYSAKAVAAQYAALYEDVLVRG